MNSLSEDIFLHLFTFLDLHSLIVLTETSKFFRDLQKNSEMWRLRKPSKKNQNLQTGAIFHHDPRLWHTSLYTNEDFLLNYESYKDFVEKIHTARPVLKSSIESKMNSALSGMLKYENDLFWNSKQKPGQESEESFVCELVGYCAVFTVQLKAYRALCQGGVMYPPKSIRISIGNEIDNFHYVSAEMKFPMTEKLTTFQVLPEIVFGRFVKVDLIGMVTPMTGGLFIVALDFIDVVGYCMDSIPMGNLEKSIFEGNFDVFCDVLNRNKQKATPFVVDLLWRKGYFAEYLKKLNRELNEVESFLHAKSLLDSESFRENAGSVELWKPSEALGDLLFEAGAFNAAFSVYVKNMDIWKVCKTAIVLKHLPTLRHILGKREPRYPRYCDLLKIAASLGREFEEFLIKELN